MTKARDISKLSAVEVDADATDTTNVTSSGALMDSELTNLAAVKAINQSLVTTAGPTFGSLTVDTMSMNGSSLTASGNLTLDVAGDIILDSDGNDILLKDNGVTFGQLTNDSGQLIIYNAGSQMLKGNSGSNALFMGTVTANAGVIVDNTTFDANKLTNSSGHFIIDSANDILLDADGGNINLRDNDVPFGNFNHNGNNLKITSSIQNGDILLTGSRASGDVTALSLDMSDGGSATFSSKIMTGNMTLEHTQLTQSSGNFIMDVAGEIILDADAEAIRLRHDGGDIGIIQMTSNDIILRSMVADRDLIFKGNDSNGGGVITALTLDMSDGGVAFFGNDIRLNDNRAARFGNDQDFRIYNDGSHTTLHNATLNQDILFKGNDDGSPITALTLDMSNAGKATFTGIVSSALGFETGNMFTTANEIDVSSGNLTLDVAGDIILDATGVGIGTTNPSSYNNYANNLVVYEAGHGGITIATGTSNHASLYFADGTSGDAAYRGYLDYDHADDSLDIGTGGTHSVTIDSSGRVGIKTSAMSSYYAKELVISAAAEGGITIVGGSSSSQYLMFADGTSGTSQYRGYIQYSHSSDTLKLAAAGNSMFSMSADETTINHQGLNSDFRVKSLNNDNMLFVNGDNNRVGIGRAPASIFEVHMATDKNIGFSGGQGELGSIPALVAYTDAGSTSDIGFRGVTVRFATAAAERLRIDSNGHLRFMSQGAGTQNNASINNHTNNYMYFMGGTSGGMFQADGTGAVRLRCNTTTLSLDTGGYARLTIDASGHVLPGDNSVYDLGSSSLRWANIFTGDLHLSNEGSEGNEVDGTTGNWTIQEGDEHLFIKNNKTGKKYKFALEEIV